MHAGLSALRVAFVIWLVIGRFFADKFVASGTTVYSLSFSICMHVSDKFQHYQCSSNRRCINIISVIPELDAHGGFVFAIFFLLIALPKIK